MKKRTIAIVTGSRAEFGLLEPVLRAVAAQRRLRLRVLVAGAHLVTGTWRDVVAVGFKIDARVPMQTPGISGTTRSHGTPATPRSHGTPADSGRGADVAALARGVAGFGRVFARLKPDVVLVLGDRIEPLAAALAASIGGPPGVRVAHVHGGDRAEGVADESIRHAITKLAHIHFPATTLSRKRLIRMGETPGAVFQVGSPSIDGLRGIAPADDATLRSLGLPTDRPFVIVLQHPIGASDREEQRWMQETLAATAGWPRLVMGPNTDPGCAGVAAAIRLIKPRPVVAVGGQGRSSDRDHRSRLYDHLPRPLFAAVLARAGAIVGNSSAGLIEAAALGVPCVNIGPRQGGRERAGNVIDCGYGRASVRAAVRRALAMKRALMMKRSLTLKRMKIHHPYGDGHAGARIARVLARIDWDAAPVRKRNTY